MPILRGRMPDGNGITNRNGISARPLQHGARSAWRAHILTIMIRVLKAWIFATAVLGAPLAANAASTLAKISLPDGVDLEIPSAWKIVTDSRVQELRDKLKSANKGNSVASEVIAQTRTVFYAVSGPGLSESIIIDVNGTPEMTSAQAMALSSEQLKGIERTMAAGLQDQLRRANSQLTDFYGTVPGTLAGKPAIVTTYERAIGAYRKYTRVMTVFTDRGQYTITQGIPRYADSESQPRMDAIKDSISFRD